MRSSSFASEALRAAFQYLRFVILSVMLINCLVINYLIFGVLYVEICGLFALHS